ncbi:hypothetical protein AO069_06495 [Pseudomonas syringae pv. syringae PD2774]|uniref:MFS transporter n=1 Tax=Pseudomonas syringae TaxID=317 RepID=UPI000736FB31|nr:MFS transporter [Pseudomonas syringae]KTB88287.1 hypothetical protein AO069_06495 [Pseudomonas syringae pv. syringae PD2774]
MTVDRTNDISWRKPKFLIVILNRIISSSIIWIDFVLIFSLTAYYWLATPSIVGVAAALYGLPGLILGPFIGRAIDRSDPIKALYISYLARGITSFALVFAPTIELFLIAVLFKGIANLAAMPTEQVIIKKSFSSSQLASGIGLLTVIDQIIKICAPFFAGILAQVIFARFGFLFSAFLAMVGALTIFLLSTPSTNEDFSRSRAISSPSFRVLLVALSQEKILKFSFTAALIQSFLLGVYDPLLALFLKQLGYNAASFGVIVSCTAVGGIIGATIYKRAITSCSHSSLLSGAMCGFGFTVLMPGILFLNNMHISILLLYALWVLNGICYALTAMYFAVTLQQRCDLETIATVSASARSALIFVMIIGPLIGSSLVKYSSLGFVFLLSGILAVVTGIAMFCMRSNDDPAVGDCG